MTADAKRVGALRARAVLRARPGMWAQMVETAGLMVSNAYTREGTVLYEYYVDEPAGLMVNIAEYVDADAWVAHIQANPHSDAMMAVAEVVAFEVYGEPSPALSDAQARFGVGDNVYRRLPV